MASLETCDTMSQDSMRTHSQLPGREWREKNKIKKGFLSHKIKKASNIGDRVYISGQILGERGSCKGWGIKPLSMDTICKTNLQASLKTVGEEDFLNFLLKKAEEIEMFYNRYQEFNMQTMPLLLALFICLFYSCDHRSVCKNFPNT